MSRQRARASAMSTHGDHHVFVRVVDACNCIRVNKSCRRVRGSMSCQPEDMSTSHVNVRRASC
eukprot:11063337-Lingulodinium_polyedra.AAC.1